MVKLLEFARNKVEEWRNIVDGGNGVINDATYMPVPHWVAELIHKRSLEILAIVTKKQQDMDIIIID